MTKTKMTALRSITASQSPTGKAIPRGETYDADPVTAEIHARAGLGRAGTGDGKSGAKDG